MRSRDFYLRTDPESKNIRDKYRGLIITLLKQGGTDDSAATRDSEVVLRMETAMAQAQMDNVSRRDPAKLDNRFTLEQLKELTPAFDWGVYLKAVTSPSSTVYLVTEPRFFRAINKLMAEDYLNDWKTYLRWHLLLSASSYLGNEWRSPAFQFRRVLTGQTQDTPDWQRCTQEIDQDMGDLLGQEYVAHVFPAENKQRVLDIVRGVETAMRQEIEAADWMQSETKREAYAKRAAVMNKIGYPDTWIDYTSLPVVRESYPANVEQATAFGFKRQLGYIGKPLDRNLWLDTPPTVNAYEDPQANTINFAAGILQPPFVDSTKDDVINYAAAGRVIGHELIHKFDDQGRKFDAKGNLRDWWSKEDAREYDRRGGCVADEYTGPVPGIAGVKQNGELTQGEDIADNGGIYLALSALTDNLRRQGKTMNGTDEHGLTNLQRFLLHSPRRVALRFDQSCNVHLFSPMLTRNPCFV